MSDDSEVIDIVDCISAYRIPCSEKNSVLDNSLALNSVSLEI